MARTFTHTPYCYAPKSTFKGYFGWPVSCGGEECVGLLHRT